MIDIHCHVLPGVDDGASSLDEALAMLDVAVQDGITTIVATPHRNPWTYTADRTDAIERLAQLRAAGRAIQILLGSESYIAPDLAEQVTSGLAWTINDGHYLLVEWPFDQYPIFSDHALFSLQLKGLRPIIAHAERYQFVRKNVNVLRSPIERGILVQVTGGSLLGAFGAEVQKTAETLLSQNFAHILASDAHSSTHRPPLLAASVARAAELIGPERANDLVERIPRQIIEDREIRLTTPVEHHSRSFWDIWKRR